MNISLAAFFSTRRAWDHRQLLYRRHNQLANAYLTLLLHRLFPGLFLFWCFILRPSGSGSSLLCFCRVLFGWFGHIGSSTYPGQSRARVELYINLLSAVWRAGLSPGAIGLCANEAGVVIEIRVCALGRIKNKRSNRLYLRTENRFDIPPILRLVYANYGWH